MRILNNRIIILIGVCLLALSSCKITSTSKNIRQMDIEFDSLNRKDFVLLNNLTAEATVERDAKGTLKEPYASNYKIGKWTNAIGRESWQTIKFNPRKVNGKWQLFEIVPLRDAGADFSLYTLMEKYPDVDYFTNVRIERTSVKKYFLMFNLGETQNVKIKADGVDLKTDKK